jgi:hypothetical protein
MASVQRFSQTGAQWKIVESAYPAEDTGVSAFTDESLASINKTGDTDSLAGIQELLNRLGSAGGGVLYLSEGRCKITGKILG